MMYRWKGPGYLITSKGKLVAPGDNFADVDVPSAKEYAAVGRAVPLDQAPAPTVAMNTPVAPALSILDEVVAPKPRMATAPPPSNDPAAAPAPAPASVRKGGRRKKS